MRPLRTRIAEAAASRRVPQYLIEKDYALSYVLAGIAAQRVLGRTLVLKGGSALKKLFFGQYRLSEDLDYSALKALDPEQLAQTLNAAAVECSRLLSIHGPFSVRTTRYVERDPHPHRQEAFLVHVQFPWHPTPLCRIKLEIAHDEPVILPPATRRLIHDYDEDLDVEVQSYQLEEIVAEKLRTLLQTQQRLSKRGWSRPRARDFYDLWRVLVAFGGSMERRQFLPLLRRKCEHRQVSFSSVDDFFADELLSQVRTHWQAALRLFVPDLPACNDVMNNLKTLLTDLLPCLS